MLFMMYCFLAFELSSKFPFRSSNNRLFVASYVFSIGCAPFQFHCKKEDKCIPGNLKCDGLQDCADNSDESGCGECTISCRDY